MIAVIDCCGSNIASVRYAFERAGYSVILTHQKSVIERADKVILPGVGHIAHGMSALKKHGLDDVIPRLKQPVLGICLGMQLLYEFSWEQSIPCLGVFSGSARSLALSPDLIVPHMGWNTLQLHKAHPLMANWQYGDHVYFVHSYGADITEQTLAECHYGQSFAAIVAKDNFYGMQFHPEKSSSAGARLLQGFLGIQN